MDSTTRSIGEDIILRVTIGIVHTVMVGTIHGMTHGMEVGTVAGMIHGATHTACIADGIALGDTAIRWADIIIITMAM